MFSFGRRRIMKMNYTRYLSIPKEWLKFKGINAGDEIELVLDEEENLVLKKTNVQNSEAENHDL